jgi:hypothetical protein
MTVMNLKITVKKSIEKSSVLNIRRSDGSTTWNKLHRGMETHDLAHYVVEKTLQFNNAFYSIIDKGFDISDFELPKDERPKDLQPKHLHPEALITEHIVNLLEIEFLNSGFNTNFITDIKQILEDNHLPFPEQLNTETLEIVRTQYHNLVNQWRYLKNNEELSVTFITP